LKIHKDGLKYTDKNNRKKMKMHYEMQLHLKDIDQ